MTSIHRIRTLAALTVVTGLLATATPAAAFIAPIGSNKGSVTTERPISVATPEVLALNAVRGP